MSSIGLHCRGRRKPLSNVGLFCCRSDLLRNRPQQVLIAHHVVKMTTIICACILDAGIQHLRCCDTNHRGMMLAHRWNGDGETIVGHGVSFQESAGCRCFDGMHCADFSKPESTVGSLPFAVGDEVAVHMC